MQTSPGPNGERTERAEPGPERFGWILEASPDFVAVAQLDGTLVYMNRAGRRRIGLGEQDDVSRFGHGNLCPPWVYERIQQEWLPIALREGSASGEGALRTLDGREIPASFTLQIHRSHSGQPEFLALVARDLSCETQSRDTLFKEAMDALRVSETRFARFMQHLPGLAWIKDVNGRYVFANDAAVKAFGTPQSELYGKTDEEVFPLKTAAQFQEHDRKAIASGTGVQVIEKLAHEDGVLHHSLVSKFPISGPDGKVGLVGGMAIDITEQRQTQTVLEESEQRFRQLAENINTVFWMSDLQKAQILYVSPAYERIWGRSCQDLYKQPRSFLDAIHPDDRAHVQAASLEPQSRGEWGDVEYRVVRPDGSMRWVRDRSFPVKDQAGQVYRIAGIAEDITEQKLAEESLRASEHRFKTLASHAPVGIFQTDAEGNCLFVNDRWCEMAGMTPEAAQGQGWVAALHPEDHDRIFQEWYTAAKQGREFASEYRFRTPQGKVTWLSGSAVALRDESGAIQGYLGTVTDFTGRKLAEEARLQSEERLRNLSDNLPLGAVYTVQGDLEGRRWFLYISAGVERLFGVTPAEVRANANTLYGLVHPEDRHRLAIAEEITHRDLTPFDQEFRSYTRSGELRWIHCRSAPRRLATGETVWEGIILDVTDRKRAAETLDRERELLETIIHKIPVMLTVYEPDTKVLRLNPAFERITGWSSGEVKGESLMDRCYPDPDYRNGVREFMQSCRDGWMDMRMRTRDGRDVETSWANIRLSNGTQVGIGLDITDRKQYEATLKDADRRKDEFLATLAHELRNPLAPLRNGLEVMKMANGHAETVEQVRDMMERQLGQMVRLIDDLLDVSRITRGKLQLRRERVQLMSVVQSAVEGSRPLIEASGHRLTVSLPPEPVRLDADPTRIAQVLANLLTNAAKYSDRGGHIRLTARKQAGEIVVSVQDNGIGIAPEHLPRLFEMFSQVRTALERSQGGLGIGLSLVKGLVEMHGGSVAARSEGLGKGSEFIVRLPVANGTDSTNAPRSSGSERAADQLTRRILVADDNRDAADSLALMLRLQGHEVYTVHDGQEAVEAAEWFRPDLALLDIGMPLLNGYETARHIREQPWGQSITLAAITGWGQEQDKRRAIEAGFDHHLTKPVDLIGLQDLLTRRRKTD